MRQNARFPATRGIHEANAGARIKLLSATIRAELGLAASVEDVVAFIGKD